MIQFQDFQLQPFLSYFASKKVFFHFAARQKIGLIFFFRLTISRSKANTSFLYYENIGNLILYRTVQIKNSFDNYQYTYMTLYLSDSVLVKNRFLISALTYQTKSSMYRQIKERFITCVKIVKDQPQMQSKQFMKVGRFPSSPVLFSSFSPPFSPLSSTLLFQQPISDRDLREHGGKGDEKVE